MPQSRAQGPVEFSVDFYISRDRLQDITKQTNDENESRAYAKRLCDRLKGDNDLCVDQLYVNAARIALAWGVGSVSLKRSIELYIKENHLSEVKHYVWTLLYGVNTVIGNPSDKTDFLLLEKEVTPSVSSVRQLVPPRHHLRRAIFGGSDEEEQPPVAV